MIFASEKECGEWLMRNGFQLYTRSPLVFRAIANNKTYFAKARYFQHRWSPDIRKWPGERIQVKVAKKDYDRNLFEIASYLKQHPKCIINFIGGFVEPYTFASYIVDDTHEVDNGQIFSFLEEDFAIEFKMIWG